jgi:hypothetical protein
MTTLWVLQVSVPIVSSVWREFSRLTVRLVVGLSVIFCFDAIIVVVRRAVQMDLAFWALCKICGHLMACLYKTLQTILILLREADVNEPSAYCLEVDQHQQRVPQATAFELVQFYSV